MTLAQFLADSVGLSVVHWDEARGLVCLWSGRNVFLEYRVTDGELEHGEAWSTTKRPGCAEDAVSIARTHYGLSRD